MQIRCPHCHNPVELLNDDPSNDVSCPSCGSCFNLAKDVETAADDGSHAKMLGHFQLLHCLGQGAFGAVWKARDTELDRIVAIKIPRKENLTEADAEKFLREARAAAQVRHPNIVSVHEVGRADGRIYIASDFIDGASLDEWVQAHPLTVRESVELCEEIAEALHHAHEAGVVHRDLKPQNILVQSRLGLRPDPIPNHSAKSGAKSGRDGVPTYDPRASILTPFITDFGLAKRDVGEITMTVEGAILGTPAYMPPEQARGEAHHADRRSDVYSLGVILFRLLTGELPFRGQRQMLIAQILSEEPPALRKLDARLPRDVETICLKCLEKDPARRYQSAAALAADLRRWLTGHPIQARPVSRTERAWRWCRRNPLLVSTLVAGLLAAVSLLAAWSTRVTADRERQLASLRQAFDRGLDDVGLTPSEVRPLETLIEAINAFDSAAASEARSRLDQRYFTLLQREINQSKLTAPDRERLDAALTVLASRNVEQAQQLRKVLRKRLGGWEVVTHLAKPFANLRDVFPGDRITMDSDRLVGAFRIDATTYGPRESVVETLNDARGRLRCELTFAADWESTTELGVYFGSSTSACHSFWLISDGNVSTDLEDALSFTRMHHAPTEPPRPAQSPQVPASQHKLTTEEEARQVRSRSPSFATMRSNGGRLRLELRRGTAVLQKQEVSLTDVPTGAIKLIAERDGTRLSVRINNLEPLRFDDIVPPDSSGSPTLTLAWPNTVSLSELRLSRRQLEESTNPLQRADDLFVANSWSDAERLYDEFARSDNAAAVQREAQFKRGLCLLELRRKDEATELFAQVLNAKDDQLSPAAGCQLWLLHFERGARAEADQLFELLQATYQPVQMAATVTEETRQRIVSEHLRMDSAITLLRQTKQTTTDLERLVAIDRLLSSDGLGTLELQIELHRAYRFDGRLADALRVLENAAPVRTIIYEIILLRHRARLLRQLGRPSEAHMHIAGWLEKRRLKLDLNLQLEVARDLIAQKRWEEAEHAINTALSLSENPNVLPAEAYLLKGFLFEQRGATVEAEKVWREGFQVVQNRGLKHESFRATFLSQLILGSLVDAPMSEETDLLYKELDRFRGLGPFASISRTVLSPATLEATLRSMWRTPRAREWARRFAFDEVSLREQMLMPLIVMASEFIRQNAFGGFCDDEHDTLAVAVAEVAITSFLVDGTLKSAQIVQYGLTWKGSFGVLGWQLLAPTLNEDLRALSCLVLAHRAQRLNQPAAAADLLKAAIALRSVNDKVATAAEADLKLLESQQGVVHFATASDVEIEVTFETEGREPQKVIVMPKSRTQLTLPVAKYRVKLISASLAPQPAEVTITPMSQLEVKLQARNGK